MININIDQLEQDLESHRTTFQRLRSKLPGVSDFMKNGELDAIDRLIRGHITDLLEELKSESHVTIEKLGSNIREGKALEQLDNLITVIDRVIGKTQFAEISFSTVGTHFKMDYPKFKALLTYDLSVANEIEGFVEGAKTLSTLSGSDLTQKIADIKLALTAIESKLEKRKSSLMEGSLGTH